MTEKLETVLQKISTISNTVDSSLIQEFYQMIVDNCKSEPYKTLDLDYWLHLTDIMHEKGNYLFKEYDLTTSNHLDSIDPEQW
jgi:hypothetical protein